MLASPVKNIKWAKHPFGDITQYFGENEALYTNALKKSYPEYYEKAGKFIHSGIDIVRKYGEHLFAVDDGIITHVKNSASGYGRHVRLRTRYSDELDLDWVYAHMSLIHVEEGQEVKKGQFIGTMGNSGFVVSGNTPYWGDNPYAGTHLHLGVRFMQGSKAVDYYNGSFGRFDPLPLFLNQNLLSSKILNGAIQKDEDILFKFYNLLNKINL